MERGGPSPYADLQPMGPIGPSDRPAAQGGPVIMKERPFFIGLLLTVVTLGIYHFFWHYATHDEICRQIGRPNEEKRLWYGYVGIAIATTVLLFFIVIRLFIVVADADRAGLSTREAVADALIGTIGFLILIGVLSVISLVLFVVYVAKQYEAIRLVRERSQIMPPRAGAGWFFGFYFGAMVLSFIPFVGILALAARPIAYYNLQEHYNDIHRAAAAGALDGPALHGPPARGMPPIADYPTFAPTSQQGGYRIADRGTQTHMDTRPVEQAFECPRCRAHVTARGPAGADVQVRCTACGEGGTVTLPR